MVEVEFNYNYDNTIILCNMKDKVKDIINHYLSKCQKKSDEVYFLYDGKELEEEKNIFEVANKFDKTRKKMNVLVGDKEEKKIIKN